MHDSKNAATAAFFSHLMDILKTILLFSITAILEILGCYLSYLYLKQGRSAWLLLPATICLALFAYLLTLHPTAAGRVYAAYAGVYMATAVMWLWWIDGIPPSHSDMLGAIVCLLGMAIIMFGSHTKDT